MQETRRQILDILKDRGEATVDDIVSDLTKLRESITAVTVRHHLAKLQADGLVDIPQMLHRPTPGRPQHVYALTQQGLSYFPNNYQQFATTLLQEIKRQLPEEQINVIIEGMANTMADDANIPQGTIHERLQAVITYLNAHGYEASFDVHDEGYVLFTSNCPYHDLAESSDHLCQMDMQLISKMLGVVPRMMSRVADGEDRCSYLVPTPK